MDEFQAREPFMACPLCGGLDFPEIKTENCSAHPLFRPPLPDTIHWCRCKQCNHVFTSGYFTDAANEILFSQALPDQQPGFEMEKQRLVAGRIVERIAARAPFVGPWLDVGFGAGALLFAAQEWGYQPVGIDMRREPVALLSRIGLEAHCTDITRLDHPGRYAVITMADVLEHMPFPTDALIAAHRLLAPNGILLVSTPNSGSIPWEVLTIKDANPYWGEIEHFHNFSRARLCAVLEQFNFKIEHFAISERYRLGMEILARRNGSPG